MLKFQNVVEDVRGGNLKKKREITVLIYFSTIVTITEKMPVLIVFTF